IDVRDISSQQQMEKALYQSRKSQAINALTGGIAHDFRNVLTGVLSQLELALASPELPGTLRDNLDQARISAHRGAELVNKLQAYSRSGQGTAFLRRTTDETPAPPLSVVPLAGPPVFSGKGQILVVD